jgi:hypothetical protein
MQATSIHTSQGTRSLLRQPRAVSARAWRAVAAWLGAFLDRAAGFCQDRVATRAGRP